MISQFKQNFISVRPGLHPIAAAVIVLAIAVGGIFQPLIGLSVPLLILGAGISSRFKRRIFCSRACPRSRLFPFLKSISRYKPIPKFFHKRSFRQMLCGTMMLCSIMQFVRVVPTLEGFAALGNFFWILCMVSLGTALLLGWLYKPAAWCAVCPMGTLQDTISSPREKNA